MITARTPLKPYEQDFYGLLNDYDMLSLKYEGHYENCTKKDCKNCRADTRLIQEKSCKHFERELLEIEKEYKKISYIEDYKGVKVS